MGTEEPDNLEGDKVCTCMDNLLCESEAVHMRSADILEVKLPLKDLLCVASDGRGCKHRVQIRSRVQRSPQLRTPGPPCWPPCWPRAPLQSMAYSSPYTRIATTHGRRGRRMRKLCHWPQNRARGS